MQITRFRLHLATLSNYCPPSDASHSLQFPFWTFPLVVTLWQAHAHAVHKVKRNRLCLSAVPKLLLILAVVRLIVKHQSRFGAVTRRP